MSFDQKKYLEHEKKMQELGKRKLITLNDEDVMKADFLVRWYARNKAEGSMIDICYDLSDRLRTALGTKLAPRPGRPSRGYVPDLTEIAEGLNNYNPED